MSSPPALVPGVYYHIFNRGINKENVFIEERNYEHFLQLYGKYIPDVAETFAWCLLRNHFHLLVRIRSQEELPATTLPSQRFSNFFNAYAKAFNRAYNRTGSLFQHPFKRILITDDHHFWNEIAYIHQNPQKHHFVNDFRDWKWSSYSRVITGKSMYLDREHVLKWFGGLEGYLEMHEDWVTDAKLKWSPMVIDPD
jgi:putative transposase